MKPLVSVIVPVYRVEAYLAECLDSILAQTYEALDVVLVDDGSPDGSGAICDRYGNFDRRLRVIHRENGGLAAARNTGIEASRGSYLAFVDADDVLSPLFVESLLRPGADVAQCGFCRGPFPPATAGVSFETLSGREMALRQMSDATGAYTVSWNKLYRRELFETLRFPAGKLHEDEFTTWKVLWSAGTCAATDAPLYLYRRRGDSIMGAGFSARSLDAAEALEERAAFYRKAGDAELAALAEASLCHRLRGMMRDLEKALPAEAGAWKEKMRGAYRAVMRSPEVGPKKKLSLSVQMLSPGLYKALKGKQP